MKKLLFLFAIAILLTSCSLYQINSDYTTSEVYPPKPSKESVVYLEKVTEPYTVIGYVTVNTERRNPSLNEIIDQMRAEAAILGGDAITNITTNAGTGKWAKIKPKKIFGNANVRTNYVADVIVFSK